MAGPLGAFLVNVVLVFVGVFLMVSAYSKKPLMLKLATLAMLKIDPDNPGRRQRAWMFYIGVGLVVVGVLLVVLDKLSSLGVI